MPTAPEWFAKELALISPDLRLVFGMEQYGVGLWVIERKVPEDLWAAANQEMESKHQERFVDQTLVDENEQPIGARRRDLNPEYRHVHFVENAGMDRDSPESYREPDRRDLKIAMECEYNLRHKEAFIRQALADRQAAKEKKEAEEAYGRKHVITTHRHSWRGDEQFDMSKNSFKESTTLATEN